MYGLLNTYIHTYILDHKIVSVHGVQYVVWEEIANLSNRVDTLLVGHSRASSRR